MAYKLENNAILNVRGIYSRYVIWNITRKDVMNMLNNTESNDKKSL